METAEKGDYLLPLNEEHAGGDLLKYGGNGSFDSSLEPFQRCRANTWHGRARNELAAADEESRSTPSTSIDSTGDPSELGSSPGNDVDSIGLGFSAVRKTTSRRNAWGNRSYADLITKAIESSPDRRLTLSQIYAWMVTNVPFFRDKGDSNSSAGWKNSIRHNLSLHSRFVRVQNEGTGKSSWWTINPDASKTVKPPRRPRALTLDTKSYERQRRNRAGPGRPLQRATDTALELHPPSFSGLDGDVSREQFTVDYRARAGSFGGRLSPIEAAVEPEVDGRDSCRFAVDASPQIYPCDGPKTLSETLADIFADDLNMTDLGPSPAAQQPSSGMSLPYGENCFADQSQYFCPIDTYRPTHQYQTYGANLTSDVETKPCLNAVPATGYPSAVTGADCRNGVMGNRSTQLHAGCSGGPALNGYGRVMKQNLEASHPTFGDMNLTEFPDVAQPSDCMFANQVTSTCTSNFTSRPQAGPAFATQSNCAASLLQPMTNGCTSVGSKLVHQQARDDGWIQQQPMKMPSPARLSGVKLNQAAIARILAERPHLMAKMQQLIEMKRNQLAQQLQRQHQRDFLDQSTVGNVATQPYLTAGNVPQHRKPVAAFSSNAASSDGGSVSSSLPLDLDLSGVELGGGEMDCDIDEVIGHELALDGKLDFVFD